MENLNYESPKVDFQEMKLLERIAAKCWGYAYAWYDVDQDGVIDPELGEKIDLKDLGLGATGCQGSSARETLQEYFKNHFNLELTKEQVSTNTDSPILKPITS